MLYHMRGMPGGRGVILMFEYCILIGLIGTLNQHKKTTRNQRMILGAEEEVCGFPGLPIGGQLLLGGDGHHLHHTHLLFLPLFFILIHHCLQNTPHNTRPLGGIQTSSPEGVFPGAGWPAGARFDIIFFIIIFFIIIFFIIIFFIIIISSREEIVNQKLLLPNVGEKKL